MRKNSSTGISKICSLVGLDRVVNGICVIDWFGTHFDIDIIYQIRHPIPFSLSVIGRGWGNVARAYLENERFCSEHLDAELVEFGWRVMEHGTPLQRYVLEWCLENIQPLRLFQQRPWLTLTYEEIVLRPKEISELICSRLGLPDPERMREVVLEASRTTTQHSRRTIREKGSDALVDKWMREIDPSDAAKVGEVLQAFGIWTYEALSTWPHPELCHFGPLGGE